MNRCWLFMMAFTAMLAFAPAYAANARHEDAETSPSGKNTTLGGVPDFGGDLTIKDMTFQELNYAGDVLNLTGPVKIDSTQFNLKGMTVVYNKTKNQLTATGSPVEIISSEDGITAKGKRAEYDTKTKKMTLYGDPATVVQTTPQKRAILSSDIITFIQGEAKGQGGLNARRRPGSTTQPRYQEFPNKTPEKKKTAEPAKKVNSNNIGTLLSAPQPDTGN